MDMTIGGLTLDSSDICIECNNIIRLNQAPCSDADLFEQHTKKFSEALSKLSGFEAGGPENDKVMRGIATAALGLIKNTDPPAR